MKKKIKSEKMKKRIRRKLRIRNSITGTEEKPRVSVFKSNKNISVQVIDDSKNATLCSVSSTDKEMKLSGCNIEVAKKVASKLAEKLAEKKIDQVVFDRNGFIYHGKIKAVADTLREKKIKL